MRQGEGQSGKAALIMHGKGDKCRQIMGLSSKGIVCDLMLYYLHCKREPRGA